MGPVQRESKSIIVQQDATIYSFIIFLQTALHVSGDTFTKVTPKTCRTVCRNIIKLYRVASFCTIIDLNKTVFTADVNVKNTALLWKIQCFRKVALHLQKVLEVMSTSIYTGLNPFRFIRKHFLQICLWDVSYVRRYCSF